MGQWQQMLLVAIAFLFFAAGATYVARLSLIQTFGKHLYDRKLGRSVTEEHYALDEQARRRIRWGTVIAAVIIFACTGACFWNFVTLLILER
ncbi:MAG: hypothetical protein JSW37_05080 [Anaerolineales bacterium]|nr:MAG: hypothetical protein JSW37_05080 [Anaerolineales bacterium]